MIDRATIEGTDVVPGRNGSFRNRVPTIQDTTRFVVSTFLTNTPTGICPGPYHRSSPKQWPIRC